MRMKNISIDRQDQFLKSSYPSEGIYNNITTGEILIINRKNDFVVFIGTYLEYGHLFEDELKAETESIPKVTESFALKLAAVLTNSDKLKDYEI